MPLGDSITESTKGLNSYRYYLWHLLLDQGITLICRFPNGVGNGPPANPDFDMDHEGHRVEGRDPGLGTLRLRILLSEPTISPKGKVSPVRSDIGGIIDVLRTVNPHTILLAQLIAKTGVPSCGVEREFAGRVAVVLVDQYWIRSLHDDYDGTHPNAIGDSHMADRWFEKLAPMLDAFLTQPGPEAGQGRP